MSNNTEQKVVKIIADGKQAEASINQLTRAVSALNRERNKEQVGSERYKELTKDVSQLNQKLSTARNEVRNLDSASKKFWGNFKTIAAGVVGGNLITMAIQGIGQLFGSVLERMKSISDEYANIRKVTGLSMQDVSVLDKQLGQIDTRTGRKELRQLAVEAGKLGIEGVENIAKFVQEADQIKVALGEDLGDDAVTTIGRLSNIFKVSMLEIGSAINEIGANSAATEGYQVDFLNRMAGTGPTVKLAADELLGYSATLQNMGQSAEVSGTALSKFFLEFIKDTEKFGQIAGMQKGQLTDLFNSQGTNAAFMAFLENLKKSKNGSVEMAKALDEMQIDGARSVGVFLSLANSVESVHQQQAIANKAIKEGTSLTNEFNIKNETFAAKWEKFIKLLKQLWNESLLARIIGGAIDLFVKLGTVIQSNKDLLEAQIQSIRSSNTEMNKELEVLKKGNLSQEDRKRLIDEINKKYKEYLPELIKESDTLSDIAEKQQKANDLMFQKVLLMKHEAKINELVQKRADIEEKLYKNKIKMQSMQGGVDAYSDPNAGFNQAELNQATESFKKLVNENIRLQNEIQKTEADFKGMLKTIYETKPTDILPSSTDLNINNKPGPPPPPKKDPIDTKSNFMAKNDIKALGVNNKPEFEDKLDRAEIDADLKKFKEEKQRDKEKEIEKKELALDIASELNDTTFELIKIRQQKELNSELALLDAKREAQLSNEKLTAKEREKIEADYQEKRRAILTDNARKEKRAAVIRATIDTALAIARANPNVPLMAIAGVAGAAQLATILAQPIPQFYEGGVTGAQDGKRYMAENIGSFSGGGIYNQPSMGLIGEKGSELVIPNWLYKSPKMINTMNALESMIYNAKPFANGGATASSMPSQQNFDDKELKMMLKFQAGIMKSLDETLKKGIVAKTFYDRTAFEKYESRVEKAKQISRL